VEANFSLQDIEKLQKDLKMERFVNIYNSAARTSQSAFSTSTSTENNFINIMSKLEIQLKCPICCDVFAEPRELPRCKHSFCLACLKSMANSNQNQQIENCPFCKKEVNFCLRDIEALPKDFKTQSILDIYKCFPAPACMDLNSPKADARASSLAAEIGAVAINNHQDRSSIAARIDVLDLSNTNIEKLNSGVFQTNSSSAAYSCSTIKLDFCSIKSVDLKSFQGFTNLTTLGVSCNQINNLSWLSTASLANLKILRPTQGKPADFFKKRMVFKIGQFTRARPLK
jgi:hypothetical protein